MKKFYSLSLLILCCVFMASTVTAQNAPIDFETGGNGADWTWTVFENADNPPVEIVANPNASGANTSATVAKITARMTGNPWAGTETMHGADIGTFSLTPANSLVKIMVYKTTISDVGIKLVNAGGGALAEIKVANTLINQWEELSFDLSSLEDGAIGAVGPYDQIVVFPDFTFDPRPQDNIVYFDNITFCNNGALVVPGCMDPTADNFDPSATEDDGSCTYAPSSPNAPIDFEPGGNGADWTWTVFENADNPPVEIVANPDASGVNVSSTVAKIIARMTGNPWAGTETMHGADIGTFSLTPANSLVKIMVYKTTISDVGIKLVNAGGGALAEIKVANTLINQWEELTFDLSSLEEGAVGAVGPYDQIVVFPDFTFDPRPQDNIVFFDNITFNDNNAIAGCTDPIASNYNPSAASDDGSCTYAITVQTDLSCYEGDGTQPFVSGQFNDWCGGCNPMTNIGGNIWEATVQMAFGGNEYKIQLDEWADQEFLTPGMPCTVTNGGFTNRFIEVTGPMTTIPYCFETCDIFNSAAGCTDPTADNFNPDATDPDGSCIYLVTFMVDMNQYGAPFGTPEVNGSWNGWCGGCQQLSDADGDGIYSGQHFVLEGPQEFKFAVDGWADQEFFDLGTSCTVTDPTGAFTNRSVNITGPITVGPYCWELCEECPASAGCTDPEAANYNPDASSDDGSCLYSVTFNVDMNCESNFTTVGVTGPFVGWCGGCFNLSDPDGDGIYSGTTDLPAGSLEYKYEINSFAGQENLIDDMQNGGTCAPITDFFNYANRLVDIPMSAVSFEDTYGSCDPCVPGEILGCTNPTAANFNPEATLDNGSCEFAVTFVLNMNQYDGTFGIPEVNGQWNGWCGGCQQLSDPDGDNIWEGTHIVPAGTNEYKFAVDGWNDQEFFDPGTSCTVTDPSGAFTNRVFTVTGVQTEGPYCWEECADCVDPCQQSLFPTAPVNLNEQSTNLVTLLSWNSVPASLGCQVQGGFYGAAVLPMFIVQGNAPDGMPVNNSQLTNGATYQWRVRCGCSAYPPIATPWSDWKIFTYLAEVNSDTNGILQSANVYPNPNSGEFDITVKGSTGEKIQMNIYDVLGNLIQNKAFQLNSDQDSFKIEIENKIKGIYFVDIMTTNSKITKKIVVE